MRAAVEIPAKRASDALFGHEGATNLLILQVQNL